MLTYHPYSTANENQMGATEENFVLRFEVFTAVDINIAVFWDI
jgi:hypothetical protein